MSPPRPRSPKTNRAIVRRAKSCPTCGSRLNTSCNTPDGKHPELPSFEQIEREALTTQNQER